MAKQGTCLLSKLLWCYELLNNKLHSALHSFNLHDEQRLTTATSTWLTLVSLFSAFYLGMVSLWSLAVIAFERWLVVCKPLGNFSFKSHHAIACCAMTWFFALCAAIPPLVGWSRSVYEDQTWGSFLSSLVESWCDSQPTSRQPPS